AAAGGDPAPRSENPEGALPPRTLAGWEVARSHPPQRAGRAGCACRPPVTAQRGSRFTARCDPSAGWFVLGAGAPEELHHRAYAAVEALDVEVLVRCVRAVRRQPESEQERVDAQPLLDERGDRHRPATAEEERLGLVARCERLAG